MTCGMWCDSLVTCVDIYYSYLRYNYYSRVLLSLTCCVTCVATCVSGDRGDLSLTSTKVLALLVQKYKV